MQRGKEIFHAGYVRDKDGYIEDLEDEVMELRAKLQVSGNDAHVQRTLAQKFTAETAELKHELHLMTTERDSYRHSNTMLVADRDFWKGEAVAWKAGYDGFLASFDGPR